MGSCMAVWLVIGALGLSVVAEGVAIAFLLRGRRAARRHAEELELAQSHAIAAAHDFNNQLAVILNYSSFVLEDLAEDDPCRQDVNEIRHAAQRACVLSHKMSGRRGPRDVPQRPSQAPREHRAAA
jgi:signal transduction histidine kinase